VLPNVGSGESVINHPIVIAGTHYNITCVSMGNPHAVVFCEDVDAISLEQVGRAFEHNPIFPDRVNTEFVQVMGNELKMRVWERGSGETLACGTGACAAAVAAVLNGFCAINEDIKVILPGGELVIKYTEEAVWLTGGCETVFDGVICI
jgi:carbamoyl-phosphate synthase large subunit